MRVCHGLLMGLTIDIRTCMPGAVNGSCGLVYLSGCSARTDMVDSSTAAIAMVDTKSFRVVVMVSSPSLRRFFRLLPALRFEEGVRRPKVFFHASRKFPVFWFHPKCC